MINANIPITDYFSLIESYPGLGNAYLSNLKNTLMNMGYTAAGWTYLADEHHIYGSSSVGVHNTHFVLAKRFSTAEMEYTQKTGNQVHFIRGKRNYELSNHLGNVQVIISDKRISVCDNELQTESFEADILMATDYYPFGMAIPERQWYTGSDSSNYRYGFNGMEKDNEAKGPGNSLDFGARIYDSRLGFFLSMDEAFAKQPYCSPFVISGNNPIYYIDVNGKYKIKPSQQGDYPILENLMANIVNVIKENEELKAHLMNYGSFESEKDLLNVIEKFSGPEVSVANISADGQTNVNKQNEITITLNISMVKRLERIGTKLKDPDISDKKRKRLEKRYKRRLAHVVETLLHETVHVGDAQKGIKNGDNNVFSETDSKGNKYEELGWAFEEAAQLSNFNVMNQILHSITNDLNELYLKNPPIEIIQIQSKPMSLLPVKLEPKYLDIKEIKTNE